MEYQTAGLWVFCLALGFSKAIDVIPGRIRNHGHYVCSTWGNYHFKTFDGGFYQFPGNCSYNLASHCRDPYQEFSVHVHRSLVSGHPFIDKITITIKDVTVQLKSNLVLLNGAVVKTPYYSFGILIHENDAYFKMYTKAGLTIMWNREDAVMLELDPRFNNHTCGLCGDYNGDPRNNEFLLEDKTLSPINFGNRQNVNDPNEVCMDTEETEVIDLASCSKFHSVCKEHLDQAAFSDCKKFLNLEPYIKACMIDMCSCNHSQDSFCLCSTITEYSKQCSHAGGRPGNWRTENFCPKQCPANMVYQESVSPCKNSCSHLEVHSLCEEHYVDGCFCPEGTVQDDYTDKGCVLVHECHCKHQGKLYAPGESIQNDCDKCHCVAGRWKCTDLPCSKVCSITGGAHFTTFDGKTYTFHGNCYYEIFKENKTNLILGKLVPCSSSEIETCLKSVTLVTDNRKSVVMFKADGTVLLNDHKVTLPHATASFSVQQPCKHHLIVQTTHGLQMQIQLLPKMQLYISMKKDSRKQLQGLCGNFNTKEGDDFTTSGGLVEATASAFANTWKALATCHDISDRLDDPCSVSIENKNYADYWCSKLEKDESPFAKCHSTIDPTEYAKRCRYDSCSCKDSEHCMCAALSSYARACAAKGIILWGWKTGICDKDITSCPPSQIYLYNLTTCQLTCRSLAEGEKAFASVFTPVDGCGCPDGQYLNENDQCVPISRCSCYYQDSYLKPQEIISTKDKHCICRNGNLVCTDQVNKTCPGGKVYFDCNRSQSLLSRAPIRRSCKTLSVEYFRTECISGCVCPNGLLDDGAGGCVLEDRCPCVHNEDIYAHGTQVKVDCNTCLCQRGRWTCTNTVCYGTCTIYGNGHYISFDNKIYDFDGKCEFVAAQDYCENDSSGGSFSVLTENIPCGTTGVTCSKSVKIFLGNTMLKLSEKHVVKTVGEGGKHVDYLTREVGIYLVIEASNGILLIWDKKTTIFIKVSPAYKGKLCGLCGNFDDNSQNDFKTRHMLQVIDVLEFGNSWKVDATCPDATDVVNPCSQNPHRHSWAEKQCGLIKSQVFKICHSKVDPKPFYEACVNDACSCDSGGDCECFCTAVAAYAQECTKAEACVYWRTPDICPIFCDYYNPKGECEWHYHPCGNHIVQTCRSINNIYTNVTITYLEGCYPTCPKNKPIFDEATKKCVTKEECGCYINDAHYKSGVEVPHYMKCYKCVCSSTGNIACEKLEESSCSSTTPITTPSITPATISPIASTKAQNCTPICSWSQWISVSYPTVKNGGDNETYHNIRKAGYDVCKTPLQISCRAKHWPTRALDELRQKVSCDVSYGLICNNEERDNKPVCFDYEIRVYCCREPDMCLHTTPQSSGHMSSTPGVTTTSSAGANATTTWTSKQTTKFSETNSYTPRSTSIKVHSTSTHMTSYPIPSFGINIRTPPITSKTTLNLPQVHSTRTKATTITSPASTSKAETLHTRPKSTPASTTQTLFTTIMPSSRTTPITILPTTLISSTTSTTTAPPATTSTVIYVSKQMTTTKGSVTSSTSTATSKYTSSESVLTSAATSSTTTPTTSVTSLTTESNKVTSTASTLSRNIETTTTASLTSSTTGKVTYSPTKSMPITSVATTTGSINTFPYTTSEVTIINKHTGTTLTTKTTNSGSNASPIATSKTTNISTPTELIQTSATQGITATSSMAPTFTTTTSKTTSIHTPESTASSTTINSNTASLGRTTVTVSESVPASIPVTTNPTTIFPITNEPTKVYTTGEFLDTSPSKSALRSTPKAISTTSPVLHESTLSTHVIPGSPSKANTLTSTPTSTSKVTTTYVSTASRPYMSNYPAVTTASYTSLTKPIIYTPTKIISTSEPTPKLTTEVTSSDSSHTTTTYSMSHMSTTIPVQSATESTIKNTIPFLTEIPTSMTSYLKTTMPETSSTGHTISKASPASSVITSSPVPTTVKVTSISSSTMCVCLYNGTSYPPGEIIGEPSNGTLCHKVVCSTECKIEVISWLCSTSSPASTSMPGLKSTSDTLPTFTSKSPQITSTIYSTGYINLSPRMTAPMVSSTTEKRGCSFEQFREPNETWMLNNCTMATCLENHTIEIIELNCKLPPVITCANGYPPIAVPDDNRCCWHWECDCVCTGWGDPHYKTFDGTYYTFQGNCTYTLVEEIEKKSNFMVYLDNYDCGTEDRVSCPRNMTVLFNTQEIQLLVTDLKDPNIQVLVNGNTIGTPYKKYGVKIYTLGINYVVEIPELGANITYNGLTFYIKLPYHLFGHNTQGQCGTCTNNQSDDCRTRDGNIVSKCEIMADSWIIEDPKKPECGKIKTTPPPSSTCQPSPLCSLIMEPIFQKCHKIVSPNDYYEACVYDSCHVPRSKIECSSLQHYGQLCGGGGICIDWRSQVPECSMPCPSDRVYNACGPAIPRTCETTPEEYSIIKDDERLVEGCFCPQGTVRFSSAVDVCVHTCGCVGPDNISRKFGEKFQFGCQDCTCIEGGSGITCHKHKCNKMSEVQCNLEGFYPEVQISPTDPCCNETVCKCDRKRCKTISPTCKLGYEAVSSIPKGHCCLQYQCVPKNVCVHRNAEYMPGAPVYSDSCQTCVCAESANNTARPEIRCTDIAFTVPCPMGFTMKKSTQRCCGDCEQTHCVLSLNDSISSYHFMKPGETILSENNCTRYSCDVIGNRFITSILQISCPQFNEDDCEPGTTEFLPDGCCKVCVKKMDLCNLYEYYDHLSYNNCRTTDLVKMSRCEGSCGTFSIYSAAARAMQHKCASCQEVQTSQKQVILECSDGSEVEYEYTAVEKCDCIRTEYEPKNLEDVMTSVPTEQSIEN